MILRIHNKSYPTKTQTSTSWYLVDANSLDTYATNAVAKNELSTTDLLYWVIDVSAETSALFAVVIRHFDDGTTEKIGPTSVYDGQTNLTTYVTTDTEIETPSIFLNHNTFVSGIGDISFRSSTIRPFKAVLDKIIWWVKDTSNGKFIYREDIYGGVYDFVLDTSKIDLANIREIEVFCAHKGSNNVISGFSSFRQEVNAVDIVLENSDNVSVDIVYKPTFSSATSTSISLTSLEIYDKDSNLIFSGLNDIPLGTLNYDSMYTLISTFDVIKDGNAYTPKKVFYFSTSSKDIRRDVVYGSTAIITYGSSVGVGDKSISSILRNGDIVDTLPAESTILRLRDFDTDVLRNAALISTTGLTNNHIEVESYSDIYSYVTNFNITNNNLLIQRYPMDSITLFTRPVMSITVQSDSSNAAIRAHDEFLIIQNDKLCSVNQVGLVTVLTSLPVSSFSTTSIEEYRVNLINDSEIYVVTNTNAILLINLITLNIDILNSFDRAPGALISAVTSNGGLIIADDAASHVYDRTQDTVVKTIEVIRSFVISSNGTIIKIV